MQISSRVPIEIKANPYDSFYLKYKERPNGTHFEYGGKIDEHF